MCTQQGHLFRCSYSPYHWQHQAVHGPSWPVFPLLKKNVPGRSDIAQQIGVLPDPPVEFIPQWLIVTTFGLLDGQSRTMGLFLLKKFWQILATYGRVSSYWNLKLRESRGSDPESLKALHRTSHFPNHKRYNFALFDVDMYIVVLLMCKVCKDTMNNTLYGSWRHMEVSCEPA